MDNHLCTHDGEGRSGIDIEKPTGSIILVGPPCAGKSCVGHLLACRLGLPHVDVDGEVETRTGLAPAEFVVRGQIARFRSWERRVVLSLPAQPQIVSTGASTLLDRRCRRALGRLGPWIWLDATAAEISARAASLAGAGGTPNCARLLAPRADDELGDYLEERRAVYERASLRVPTDGRRVEEVVAQIQGHLPTRVETGADGDGSRRGKHASLVAWILGDGPSEVSATALRVEGLLEKNRVRVVCRRFRERTRPDAPREPEHRPTQEQRGLLGKSLAALGELRGRLLAFVSYWAAVLASKVGRHVLLVEGRPSDHQRSRSAGAPCATRTTRLPRALPRPNVVYCLSRRSRSSERGPSAHRTPPTVLVDTSGDAAQPAERISQDIMTRV